MGWKSAQVAIAAAVAVAFACSRSPELTAFGATFGGKKGAQEAPAPSVPGPTNPDAPLPDLGPGLVPPLMLAGLSPAELDRIRKTAPGSRLGKMRALAIAAAKTNQKPLPIEPGRHLIDRRMNSDVPANEALDLGFLISWNELMDALGVAYAITGDAKYAEAVDVQLLPWERYSPPFGKGGTVGGEPSIYHRNFFGAFRAIEQCWPALSGRARAAAVHLVTVIEDRTEDFWKWTPWERGNHAAASAQTGLLGAIVLSRIAATCPELVTPADAAARLAKFLNAGGAIPQAALVGGDARQPGLLGFGPQSRIGILTPQDLAIWRTRGNVPESAMGASLDFFYKPSDTRFGYHALVVHHVLTAYWAIVRGGLDRGSLDLARDSRLAIGSLLEFSRPYLERGELLPEAKGTPPNPATDPRTREIVAMGARLFPEKAWLVALVARGVPTSFAEIYAEAAAFK